MDSQTTAMKITAQEIMDAITTTRSDVLENASTKEYTRALAERITTQADAHRKAAHDEIFEIRGKIFGDVRFVLEDTKAMREEIAALRQLIVDLAEMIQAPAQPAPVSGGSAPAAQTWCEIHNAEMQRHDKDGDVWYSHAAKRQDGSKYFCKGKKEKGTEPHGRLNTIGQTHTSY